MRVDLEPRLRLVFFMIDTHFFVHANAYPSLPLTEQPDLMLYWESFFDTGTPCIFC